MAGFTLTETVIAIVVGALILLCVIRLFGVTAKTTEDNSVTQAAELRAEEGLSALTAVASQLSPGGTFARVGDTDIQLVSECGPSTCDLVFDPEPSLSERTSIAGGVPYGGRAPEGSTLMFVRRWQVEDIRSGDYSLRKVTIAVQRKDVDTTPAVLEETIIPTGQ